MSRPKNQKLAGYTLTVKRGPDAHGRWNYRLMWWETTEGVKARKSRSLGWLTAQAAAAALGTAAITPENATPAKRGHDTVRDLVRAWLATVQTSGLAPRTVEHYQEVSRRLLPQLGPTRLDRLSFLDLEGYRNLRLTEGRSPRTVRQDFAILRVAWGWAYRAGYVATEKLNCPVVRIPKTVFTVNHRTPEPAEVQTVIDAVLQEWHRDCITVIWGTGARISSIVRLRWEDIDLDGRRYTRQDKGQCHTCPMTSRAVAVLLRRYATQGEPLEGFVFPAGASNPASSRTGIGNSIRRGCRVTGTAPWTPHGLRRLMVRRLIAAEVPVHTAATITGHSVTIMLTLYAEVQEADQRAALEALEQLEGPETTGKVLPFRRVAND